jgi:polyisoprenoid-binding protein YceI
LEQDPASPRTYRVVPSRSAIIVKARSNVGPIAFATGNINGSISAAVDESGLMVDSSVMARLEIRLNTLASGNSLYDAELMRRVDARRFPLAIVDLASSSRLGATDDFDLKGNLTVHGVTRPINGKVTAEMTGLERITVDGEQVIDIRDFALGLPSTLMLKIYPDVWIEMHLEAEFAAQT